MKPLSISFSGGRSSAVMTMLCFEKYPDRKKVVIFANTGAEHPRTLDFVRDFERNTGIPVVWVEALVNPEPGKGIRASVVCYDTASRNHEPFKAMAAKYGIPGPGLPQCTSRLKVEPMRAYLRSIGWRPKTYQTAIGLRADEIDRINYKGLVSGDLIYPLIDDGVVKGQVVGAMSRFDWDLDLPGEHYGNCVVCWKKTRRKLLTIAQDDESWFDGFHEIELSYSGVKASNGERRFFRGNHTTRDILKQASANDFERYVDSGQCSLWHLDPHLDVGGGCGESCEVFSDILE